MMIPIRQSRNHRRRARRGTDRGRLLRDLLVDRAASIASVRCDHLRLEIMIAGSRDLDVDELAGG